MNTLLNTRDGRYHKNVYWPNEIQNEINNLLYNACQEVKISKHCRENMINNFFNRSRSKDSRVKSYSRQYNLNDINMSFLERAHCFEAYVSDGKIVKASFRASYGYKKDLCVVIAFENEYHKSSLNCVTAWINLEGNKRNDFSRSKYVGGVL